MTDEDVAVRLTDHENEIGSLKHRMYAVEENQKALTALTASVRELAADQGNMKEDIREIKTDVKGLTSIPGKRWNSLVDKLDKPARRWESLLDKALWLAAGAFLAWVLSGMPGVGA